MPRNFDQEFRDADFCDDSEITRALAKRYNPNIYMAYALCQYEYKKGAKQGKFCCIRIRKDHVGHKYCIKHIKHELKLNGVYEED